MAGRKRKIPEGYIPQWNSDYSTDSDYDRFSVPKKFNAATAAPTPPGAWRVDEEELHVDEVDDTPFTIHDQRHNNGGKELRELQGAGAAEAIPTIMDLQFVTPQSDEDASVDESLHDEEVDYEQYTCGQEEEDDDDDDDGDWFILNPNFGDISTSDTTEENGENGWYYPSDDEVPPPPPPVPGEQEDRESFQYLLSQLSEDWIVNEVDHKVSKTASSEFWNIAAKWMFAITAAFIREKKKKFPKFPHIRKKLKKKHVPRVSLETAYINKETRELTIAADTDKVPVSQFPPDKYQKVYESAKVKV